MWPAILSVCVFSLLFHIGITVFNRLQRAHFSVIRYELFALFPVGATAIISYWLGWQYLVVFVASALVGPLAEIAFGYYYHRLTGEKLWLYERLSVEGYTSYLIMPAWGFAGVLFILLGQIINLVARH